MKLNLHFHRQIKTSVIAMLCLFTFGAAHAQTQSITGTVTSDGAPLPGVSVLEKGTTNGVVTDFDGAYTIEAGVGSTLVFSYLGFSPKEVVVVSGETTINVSLVEDIDALDEIVLIGYGQQKRREVQGAIETVKSETIDKSGTTDVVSALQGQIAGVNVTASSGQPGANAVVLIRGINSVFGSNEPLYVVDGIVQQDNPQLSPNEIESIDVIKDAASAAVYGTRGTNGVILITTKRGREGRTAISVNSYYGQQKIVSGVPLLNIEEILAVDFRRANNINNDAFFDNTFNSLELNPFGLTNDSDVTGIVENDLAPIQSHNINLSGGKDGLLFNLSSTFFDQEGALVNSGIERFNIRANTTFEKGRFRLTSGINLRTDVQDLSPFNLLLRAYAYKPYNAPVEPSGDVVDIGGSSTNNDAVALGQFARILRQTNVREGDDFNFNLQLDYKLSDALTFTSRGSFGRRNVLQTRIDPRFEIFTDDGVAVVTNPRSGVNVSNRRRSTFNLENYVTYNKYFGDHHVTATALFAAEKTKNTFFSADGRDFLNDVVTNLGGTTSDENPVNGNEFENSIIGTLGRVQYDYKGKYFVSGLVRVDASSRFPSANRWIPLPSASAAWIVSEEKDWANIMGSNFNFLKFRFSYGTAGNQFLGDFVFQPTISIDRDAIFGSGANETLSIGQIQDFFANANVKWERKVEANFGIEMGFFDNKLSITSDVYDGSRTDMLFNVLIPPSVGSQANNVTLNVGDMRNYGYELGARYNHLSESGDFSLNIGATYSQNDNQITRMSSTNTFQLLNSEIAPGLGGGANNDATTALREGFEAGAFFLYETEGLITTQEQLDEYRQRFPSRSVAELGELRIIDQPTVDTDGDGIPDTGDGILNEDDRVFKGSGAPEFELGLNVNVAYKGFDLAMQWYGSFGAEILNGSKSFGYRAGTHRDLLNSWSLQNPTSNIPADRGRDTFSYRGFTDFFLEDGTFVRLRNIQLGYTVPTSLTDRIGLSKARIYIAADNPITFTNYSGFDPEAGAFDQFNQNSNGINRRGIDSGNFPIVSQFRAGIQLNF